MASKFEENTGFLLVVLHMECKRRKERRKRMLEGDASKCLKDLFRNRASTTVAGELTDLVGQGQRLVGGGPSEFSRWILVPHSAPALNHIL